MEILVFLSLGLLIAILVFCWMIRFIDYDLTEHHLRITFLGICVRRISLANVETVSKRHGEGLSENWWNTVKPSHRMLILRKRRGVFQNVVITPKNRYILKADLERAIQSLRGSGGPDPKTAPLESPHQSSSEPLQQSGDLQISK